MPEITNAEYQEYMSLQTENKRLKEDAENTAKWLKANREEIKTLKEEKEGLQTTISEKEATISEKDKAISEKEDELNTVKETAEKWTSHEESQKEAMTQSIEKMKTDLWDKFNDDVKSFIEDLPDNKVESYLKSLIPANNNPPQTNGGDKGDNPWDRDPSTFDSITAWKTASDINVSDMISALWNASE